MLKCYFFFIINILIIKLVNLLEKPIYHDFHIIYYTLKTYIYQHLEESVSEESIFFIIYFIKKFLKTKQVLQTCQTQKNRV
jgi:hypothetical protein